MGNQASSPVSSSISVSDLPDGVSSQELWNQADSKFAEIKKGDDALRKLYSLNRTDASRPDTADPFHDLITMSDEDLINLRKQMRFSYHENHSISGMDRIRVTPATKRNAIFLDSCSTEMFKYEMLSLLMAIPEFVREHICLAGGALVDMISGKHPSKICDYDLYVVGTNEPEKVLLGLLHYLNESDSYALRSVFRSRDAVTFTVRDRVNKTNLRIQVILRSYSSPSEVVTGFDLDASAICWHEGQLYMTKRSLYSLRTMTLFHDVDRMSTSYNYRLLKYSNKKGFTIRLPIKIGSAIEKNSFEHIKRNQGRFRPGDQNTLSFLYTAPIMMSAGVYNFTISDYEDGSSGTFISTRLGTPLLEKAVEQKIFVSRHKSKPILIGYSVNHAKSIDIDQVINFPIQEGYLGEFELGFPRKLEFQTVNPGSQFTGSFNPVQMTVAEWSTPVPIVDLSSDDKTYPQIRNRYRQQIFQKAVNSLGDDKPLPVLMELPQNHNLRMGDTITSNKGRHYYVVAVLYDHVVVSTWASTLFQCPVISGTEGWPSINYKEDVIEEDVIEEKEMKDEMKKEDEKEDDEIPEAAKVE
jgi:hypothetical protein